jgi:hypothetical protein
MRRHLVTSIQDLLAPQLDSLSVTPPSVDVTTGSALVHVRAVVHDDLSGLEERPNYSMGNVTLISPSGGQAAGANFFHTGGSSLIGVFECDVTIPRYSESGTWTLDLMINDKANNLRRYDSSELASLGFPSSILNAFA